jgi:tripartite-type tricarboxylate transporter receptor subunit TctC
MHALRSKVIAATLVLGVAAGTAVFAAHAQDRFPERPIRFVVGYAPGGSPDRVARMTAKRLSERLKQPVMVENLVGEGGVRAALHVAKAAADGYTLLWAGGNFEISAALRNEPPYDPLNDFVGISRIGHGVQVLTVAPSLGVKSVKELIALAIAQPRKIVFAVASVGSGPHLTGARFNHIAGIDVVPVIFKGLPDALKQVMAARAHYTVTTLGPALPFIREGQLLALAVNTSQRWARLPDVPALAETLPEFKRQSESSGLLAPAGTPRSVLNRVSEEIAAVFDMPDVKQWLDDNAYIAAVTTPEEYDRVRREQYESASKLVVEIGLKEK